MLLPEAGRSGHMCGKTRMDYHLTRNVSVTQRGESDGDQPSFGIPFTGDGPRDDVNTHKALKSTVFVEKQRGPPAALPSPPRPKLGADRWEWLRFSAYWGTPEPEDSQPPIRPATGGSTTHLFRQPIAPTSTLWLVGSIA